MSHPKIFAPGDYPDLNGISNETGLSLNLDKGFQAVLYEKENFLGNSLVLSAHDLPRTFDLSGTILPQPRSMRILDGVSVVPGNERDTAALNDALNADGWLQKSMQETQKRLEWMLDAKFGCFVHWGVYAQAGAEWNGQSLTYGEHIQRHFKLTLADYKEHFIDKFNPTDFNADEWIELVKEAGMKYFVITAKHHDGFAINVSDVYPYDIRMTPFGRDPIAELKAACDKHGLPFGLYYSHAFDWEHPDAPGNDWEYTNGGGDKFLFEGEKGLWFDQHPELVHRTAKYYVDTKSIPQIVELIEKYKPSLLWFDTPHKLPFSENLRILKAIRDADPNIIVNGRLARTHGFPSCADYVNTADRATEIYPTPGVWETIPTTNDSYGYSRRDKGHKPPEHFIELLIKTVARGGNVLMNMGPTERGVVDDVDKKIFRGIGKWLKVNGDSIYGCTRSPLPVQTFGETTRKGGKLFLHLFKPCDENIVLAGLINPVKRAYLMADEAKTPLAVKRINYFDTQITLPSEQPAWTVLVVEFDGELLHGGGRLVNGKGPLLLKAFDADYVDPDLSHADGKKWRDYYHNFKNAEQSVAWKVRTNKKTRYKLGVIYSTESPECGSTYSIYANGVKQVKAISPECPSSKNLWTPKEPFTEEFLIEIDGEKNIVFRPEKIMDGFLRLHGITLTATDEELETDIMIEKDTTDVGVM
ncbi:MAG: alpha-L-fucosidase [Defluviitaleaceae bacterium]|nr:alpha-L-fucosidase [Defluviitaleaceae bacterium]